MPPLILTDHVSFRYPAREMGGAWALNDISLEIGSGEFVAILGANGSGKTTFARHLNGLLLPERGQVRVGGLGVKIFSGIMLGVLFHLLNGLSSSLGIIQNWAPFYAAVLPSLLFLSGALAMMWWVERR